MASPVTEKGREWRLSLAQYALGAVIVIAGTVLAALGRLTVEWAALAGAVYGGGSYAVGKFAQSRGVVKAAAWAAEAAGAAEAAAEARTKGRGQP